MKKTMIVVADSYCARIFNVEAAHSTLTEVETLINPEGRLHDRDITSDLPGKMEGVDGSGGMLTSPAPIQKNMPWLSLPDSLQAL